MYDSANPSIFTPHPTPRYLHLTLNPSPEGEGLKELYIRFFHPFSSRRRGRGMRCSDKEKGLGDEVLRQGEGAGG
jgi:hypothetical protein